MFQNHVKNLKSDHKHQGDNSIQVKRTNRIIPFDHFLHGCGLYEFTVRNTFLSNRKQFRTSFKILSYVKRRRRLTCTAISENILLAISLEELQCGKYSTKILWHLTNCREYYFTFCLTEKKLVCFQEIFLNIKKLKPIFQIVKHKTMLFSLRYQDVENKLCNIRVTKNNSKSIYNFLNTL